MRVVLYVILSVLSLLMLSHLSDGPAPRPASSADTDRLYYDSDGNIIDITLPAGINIVTGNPNPEAQYPAVWPG